MANDTEATILARSTELFGESGFDGVSIRDIAEAVGVTLGAIYHYFPNKQALYDEVVRNAFYFMTEKMVAATRLAGTPHERLRAFVRTLVKVLSSQGPQMRIVDREIFEARGAVSSLAVDAFLRPHDALATVVAEINPNAPVDEFTERLIATIYGSVKLRTIRTRLSKVPRLHEPALLARSIAESALQSLLAYVPQAMESAPVELAPAPAKRRRGEVLA